MRSMDSGFQRSSHSGNAVKANDALAALKMAVGMNPNADGSEVSPYQYLAADVNHVGQVKAADALNILKMAVKLSSTPEMEWLFVPESVGSESMSRTHVVWPDNPIPVTLDMDQDVHLIGIVKGDVDRSLAAWIEQQFMVSNSNFFINCLHLRNTYFLTGDMLKLSTRALLYGGMNIFRK